MNPSLILINPWIYDFAAYDLWSKPLGLLSLAASMRRCGFRIHLIDCLDVHHPGMPAEGPMKPPKRGLYGTGKFWREVIPTPPQLKGISRPYSRYGILPEVFQQDLEKVKNPAAVLVTSLMTYWYPGIREAVRLTRKVHPGVPVILGGIYARLCRRHALREAGADIVVSGTGLPSVRAALGECGIDLPGDCYVPEVPAYPAFDLLTRIDYVCIMTSSGCPYGCRYCASRFLQPSFVRRRPEEVLEEILFWHRDFGVSDFAFYDDALLVGEGNDVGTILRGLARLTPDLRFHTPNALHVREITPETARIMYRAGFQTVRLGLETSDMSVHRNLDGKVSKGDFERALCNLLRAGFELSRDTLNRVGLAALLMSSLPAMFEIGAITLLAPPLLGLTWLEAAILGSILGAVSPAVVVPLMIDFMERGKGADKGIPTLLLAASSVDDVFVIVIFTILLGMTGGGEVNWLWQLGSIPVSIILGIIAGIIPGYLLYYFFER